MDLEQRVTALEAEMRTVRQEAAAARALAAGADRDVAEYRAEMRQHTRMLNALRDTQVEQGAAIAELRTETERRFDEVQSGLVAITRLLERLTDPPSTSA